MPVSRLLREVTVGETRWVALDSRDKPVALYLERASDAARGVIGERLTARVRKGDAAMGGVFVDLGTKGEAFLRLKSGETLNEGASVAVEVAAEARRGKLTRVRMADTPPTEVHGPARWAAQLAGGTSVAIEHKHAGDSEIQAAFDDALAAGVTLDGGGRLHAQRTEALVAVDIDTAGRASRGGRAANALAVNLAAAAELARQIHLRGWGGLAVLDCVAPIDKAAGGKVRAAFLEAFRGISNRQVKALDPSAFGLMEISADWALTPLEERLLDAGGRPSPETAALDGLRKLEARARESRMGRLELRLPAAAYGWLSASGLDAAGQLAGKYGARLGILPGDADVAEVRAVP